MTKSFIVPSSDIPEHSPIYRHPRYPDGTHQEEYADIDTMYKLFTAQVTGHPKQEFLGAREYFPENQTFGKYRWTTTCEASEIVSDFGSGLDSIYANYAPGVNSRTNQQALGIFAANRPEWLLSEFAAFRSNRYTVGITDASGVELAEFQINDSSVNVIVCSVDKIPRMLERIKKTPGIKVIISMEKLDCTKPLPALAAFSASTTQQLEATAKSLGIVLLDMDEVIRIGRINPTQPSPPSPTDYCILTYSSGSTGAQKGILFAHGPLTFAACSMMLSMQIQEPTYYSYLSLCHITDRISLYTLLLCRLRVGFYSGDRSLVFEDLQMLKPTILVGIPRVFNHFYESASAATIKSKSIVGILSRIGYKSKLRRINAGEGFEHALWDKLLFKRLKNKFGGNVQIVVIGGASLIPEVQKFCQVALSCNVVQGYGLTENAGCISIQSPDDFSTGNVGIPNAGIDVRLRSIREMGYIANNTPIPRGELMVRGENVFSGYYNLPDRTGEIMDGDWMATGDIAQINSDGTITIIDRMNSLIKTSVTWVGSQHLEQTYSSNRLVNNIFVYGRDNESKIVAVVVPEPKEFVPWAQNIACSETADLVELCKDTKVIEEMTKELNIYGKKLGIMHAESVRMIHLEPQTFDKVKSEFYTFTYKIRRIYIAEYYKPIFDDMYALLKSRSGNQ
ncbi:medium-chain fatty acid-CoA ligase faa2 [Coemansia sp. RSA 1722]|nr:medium-chain fatty acid-CoA ligase faa2 [Coemansia sp. RSA 486]KAJ2237233.1 medium-chain fatty acid-CoA ligase faa2 [Coemansia sp. RSA 485]KAJ2599762.1 medium-chain fatty acid-CoA ligase faa2 [Coemansia sp. RSA 1721]KAJ2601446.1 medium-chain fatty acid-CoA ligase faa2 [Coemansia sp. RSA 1722]KAJ2638775.1 medium-chain fatty acid-CoA ligase faa2 [Coemansia sp. RSA 1286]